MEKRVKLFKKRHDNELNLDDLDEEEHEDKQATVHEVDKEEDEEG